MLPFTQERLQVNGKDIFYYNHECLIPEIYNYSNQINTDLGNYLGIEFEVKQRAKFAKAVDDEGKPGYYSIQKINRIMLLYDFYIDSVLKTTQLLYDEIIHNNDLYRFCSQISGELQKLFVPRGEENNPQFHQIVQEQKFELMKQTNQTKKDSQVFMVYFKNKVIKSGRRLKDCFNQAIEKCQSLKEMIEQQIDLEFPFETFQDKIVQKEKIVVSKKKIPK